MSREHSSIAKNITLYIIYVGIEIQTLDSLLIHLIYEILDTLLLNKNKK